MEDLKQIEEERLKKEENEKFKKNTKDRLAERLEDLITEKKKKTGLTNNEIADKIGIGQGQLSKALNSGTELGISSLVRIAKYFDVSTDYLLGLSDVRSTKEEFKTVHKVTGLLDGSITNLASMNKNDKESIYILNLLLDQNKETSKSFKKLLFVFKKYLLSLLNTNQKHDDLKYIPIPEQDIRQDYEESQLYDELEGKEYYHLFRIGEFAKQLAIKLKNENK